MNVPVQPVVGVPECSWRSCPRAVVITTSLQEMPLGVVPSSASLTETE